MNKGFVGIMLVVAAAAVLAVAVIFLAGQVGKNTGTPQYTFPGITEQASPAPAIKSASDLKTTQKDLDTTDIDGSMNTELNLLNADGTGL